MYLDFFLLIQDRVARGIGIFSGQNNPVHFRTSSVCVYKGNSHQTGRDNQSSDIFTGNITHGHDRISGVGHNSVQVSVSVLCRLVVRKQVVLGLVYFRGQVRRSTSIGMVEQDDSFVGVPDPFRRR